MGLAPIYQRPKTSEPHPQHRIWPYLLARPDDRSAEPSLVRGLTYIPMRRGFLYLVAIMDWFSRKVLAWRLSNTMDADFCVTALEEAIARFGRPESSIPTKVRSLPASLYQHLEGCQHSHLDGWSWPLDGQRLHRAALAIT